MRAYMDNYGTLMFNGIEITLKQEPYADTIFTGYDKFEAYVAYAEDSSGNEYKITWPIINEETEDESECCDWENNFEVREI